MLMHVVHGLLWTYGLLPLRVQYVLSDLYFVLVYHVVRYRRRVVRTNLNNAFPEKSPEELLRIERKFYRHLCDLFVEMVHLCHMSPEEIRRRCVFRNPELILDHFKEGRSVIGILGHFGNWEWLTSFGLWMPENGDFYTLYKPLHNKVADRMMVGIRSRFKAVPVPRQDILRRIIANRQQERLFLAGLVGDQTPNVDHLDFWMEFLHQDTPVFIGTEKLARKFGLAVISLHMRCVRRGYYEVEFVELSRDPKSLEPGELTRMHTRMLEKFIRETPELWLWSHKRWKHSRKTGEAGAEAATGAGTDQKKTI